MKKIIPISNKTNEKMDSVDSNQLLPPLLTLTEVCEYLGLGQTKVYEMIRTCEIPSIKVRNRIRVLATDLRKYLDDNRISK